MKRFLLTGLMILGLGQFASYAQQRGSYQDDIYYNSSDVKKSVDKQKQREEKEAILREQQKEQEQKTNYDGNTYSSSGNDYNTDEGSSTAYQHSYETDADNDGYIDDNDDFYYSSRVRKFGYSYSGMYGYYSPFYDPFWYHPWYSPYPYSGVTVSIGWGTGPYWAPYYSGWNMWYGYGYPGYYNPWYYPYYGYGGGYCGYGYNDGFYGNGCGYGYGYGGYSRNVVYGPRTSLGSSSYGPRSMRTENSAILNNGNTFGPQRRMGAPNNGAINNEPSRTMRSSRALPDNAINTQPERSADAMSPRSDRFEQRNMQQEQPQMRQQRGFGRFFGNGSNNNAQRLEQRQEQPMRQEMRSEPRYEQPRYQQRSEPSQQRMGGSSSPSRSYGSGSFGGSSGGRRR